MMDNIKEILLDPTYGISSPIGIAVSTTLGVSFSLWRKWRKMKIQETLSIRQRPKRLILITGCDSGLGFSMAFWAANLGYNVIAGCLDENSEGAKTLRKEFCDKELKNLHEDEHQGTDSDMDRGILKVVQLDVTKEESIISFKEQVEQFMQTRHTKLWAVISNAAVMVCGEFLWQTKSQRHRQMDVNFWGTVNLTTALSPLIFHQKSRLIVISSDCSKLQFPQLGMYAASKTALEAWARSFRLEVAKYGISVVSYHPGSFPLESQILSNHDIYYKEMEQEMSPYDREFYGEYFKVFSAIKIKLSSDVKAKLKPDSMKPITSTRAEKDFKFLLEGDITSIPVKIDVDLIQRVIYGIEAFFPRWISDKMLCFMLDLGKVKWAPPTSGGYCGALIRSLPK